VNRSQVGDDTVNCQDVVVLELCPHIHFVLIALYGTSVKVVVSRVNEDYLNHSSGFCRVSDTAQGFECNLGEVSVIQLHNIFEDRLTFSPSISPSQMSL
jgi:hypothetical protein